MVKISILIPVFNGVEFLEECLNSVKQQTYPDWEVLIGVNGHGADGGEVAKKATELADDPRFTVFVQGPPLKGKVESLNDLMKHVKSDWVCILDCDDYWLPTKLEEQVACLNMLGGNVDVIGTLCRYFGERTGSPQLPTGHINLESLAVVNPIVNSSSLIRREHCYWRYTSICYAMEDYDLWMRIAFHGGKLYNIPKVLCYHRIHKQSAFNTQVQNPALLQNKYRNRNAAYFTQT